MTSGLPPTLKPRQIEQIVRDRLAGLEYKQIARRVGCTPNQAIHYWRISTAYQPEVEKAAGARRRQARAMEIARAKKGVLRAERQIAAAAEALRREIALALSEQATAPRFKPGPLDWHA